MLDIVVEATPKLRAIDLVALFAQIHDLISEQGTAVMDAGSVVVGERP